MRRSSAPPGRFKSLLPRAKWIQLSTLSLFWLAGCQPQAPGPDYSPPHSPQTALDTFELAPGFEMDVFAAEPLIRDPVAMEIDEDGRIYVVEMGGGTHSIPNPSGEFVFSSTRMATVCPTRATSLPTDWSCPPV